ncbi:MAG: hypothetical protein H7Z38_24205, partial [Rubrivivax sp.]|nr:hypothetical protein [Pyrinomonadaceae bacterium]
MNRKLSLLLIVTPILLAALVILPVSLAQRRSGPSGPERIGGERPDKSKKEKAGKKTTPAKSEMQFAARPRAISKTDTKLTPVSSRAVHFSVSPALRDLPESTKRPLPRSAWKNIKANQRRSIRSELADASADSKEAKDPVIQSSAPELTIPNPIVSFEGQDIFETIAVGQGFLPPDTVGDVGPNHYVQSVNSTFRVYNKNGTPATPVRSLGDLFSTIPGPCANTF